MRLWIYTALISACVAGSAQAATVFFTGNDIGAIHSTGTFWGSLVGYEATSNFEVSTTVDATTGNRYSIHLKAASEVARALVTPTFTASGTLYASMRLRVVTPPAAKRRIISLENSGGGTGCVLAIAPVAKTCSGGSNAGEDCTKAADCPGGTCPALTAFKLATYYGDIDITGGECSASQMDYTECGGSCSTSADCVQGRDDVACSASYCINECKEAIVGESSCAPGIMAQTSRLAVDTWYLVTLKQANSGGNVTCALYQGAASASPKSYPRGGQTRPQGKCSGGTNANYACDDNADCNSNNCDLSPIVTIDRVAYGFRGTETTGGTGAEVYLDDFYVDDADAYPNYRVEAIGPSGNGTVTTEWTDNGTAHSCGSGAAIWNCLNDSPGNGGPDGNSSSVQRSGGTSPPYRHDTALSDPSTGGTPQSVVVVALAQDWQGGGDYRLDIWDGSTAITGNTVNLGDRCVGGSNAGASCTTASECPGGTCVGDEGTNAGYYSVPGTRSNTKPGGGAWDATALNALQVRFNKIDGLAGNRMRTTAVVGEVLFSLTDPAIPDNLSDKTGDGQQTVCAIGGSGYNDDYFHQVLASMLEPENIIECAKGGYTVGDVVGELAWAGGSTNDILDGYGTSFNTCTVLKGVNAPCDYVMVEIGVNSMHAGTAYADPANRDWYCAGGSNEYAACTVDSQCPGGYCMPGEYGLIQHGYCDDNGGANQGQPCYCQRHSQWYSNAGAKECSGGANAGTRCTASSECPPAGSCSTAWYRYCRVRGSDWKTTCLAESDCACSTNADCKLTAGDTAGLCRICLAGSNENAICTAASECPGSSCGYACAKLGRYYSRDDDIRVTSMRQACTRGTNNAATCTVDSQCPGGACASMPVAWCTGGCLSAPGCTSGLCISGTSEAYMREQYKLIVEKIQGRSYCLSGSNPGTQCASNGDCTGGGTCTGHPVPIMGTVSPGHIKGGKLNWQGIEKKAGAFRSWMLPYLRSQSVNYIDTWSYLWANCTDLFTRDNNFQQTGSADCLRDPIHWTEYGQDIVAGAISDCIAQSPCTGGLCEGGTCVGGYRNGRTCSVQSSDGVCDMTPTCSASACSGGAQAWCAVNADCYYCTAGRVNDKCATNADCDLYRCVL